MNVAIQGLIFIISGVGGCLGYFYLSNQLLDKVLFPPRGENSGRNINRANMIRPWLFIFPVILMVGVYTVYPVFETLRLSLTDRNAGGAFVGLANYQKMFRETVFWEAMRNNMLWLSVVPAASTAFGLLIAQLTDRIAWGNIAKSIIFMPMAISFVGASVIFKLIYDTQPENREQIGVLNTVWMQFEGGNGSFLFLRIFPAIILWGFAAVAAYVCYLFLRPFFIPAALRGIPQETVEAAIIDGATPFQLFFRIKVPQIIGTIVVVWTLITVLVLKVFDIVFVLTNGNWNTEVLANYLYRKIFHDLDWGVGSASAIILLLLVSPIMIWNVRNVRKEIS